MFIEKGSQSMGYFVIIICKTRATLAKQRSVFWCLHHLLLSLKMLPSLRAFHVLTCAVSCPSIVYLGVWAIREQNHYEVDSIKAFLTSLLQLKNNMPTKLKILKDFIDLVDLQQNSINKIIVCGGGLYSSNGWNEEQEAGKEEDA